VFKPCTGQAAVRKRCPRDFLSFAHGFAKRGADTALTGGKEGQIQLFEKVHSGMARAWLDTLDHVGSTGAGARSWIKHDPDFTNIRELPRFKQIMARLQ